MGVVRAAPRSFDETTGLPTRGATRYRGAGVTATDDAVNGWTDVYIPGGGSGGALRGWYDIKDYGAVADAAGAYGSGAAPGGELTWTGTDNKTAIEAASAAAQADGGGVVYIPPGKFCTSPVQTGANVDVVGAGPLASWLCKLGSNATTEDCLLQLGGLHVSLRDVKFSGAGMNRKGRAVDLGWYRNRINNCVFHDWKFGVTTGDTNIGLVCQVTYCEFERVYCPIFISGGASDLGATVGSANMNLVYGCRMAACDYGVVFDRSDSITIEKNVIEIMAFRAAASGGSGYWGVATPLPGLPTHPSNGLGGYEWPIIYLGTRKDSALPNAILRNYFETPGTYLDYGPPVGIHFFGSAKIVVNTYDAVGAGAYSMLTEIIGNGFTTGAASGEIDVRTGAGPVIIERNQGPAVKNASGAQAVRIANNKAYSLTSNAGSNLTATDNFA